MDALAGQPRRWLDAPGVDDLQDEVKDRTGTAWGVVTRRIARGELQANRPDHVAGDSEDSEGGERNPFTWQAGPSGR